MIATLQELERLQAENRALREALAWPQPNADYREIHLTQGYIALVDIGDFPELARYSWFVKPSDNDLRYACRMAERDGHRIVIRMHQQLMGIGDGRQVDHRNHNGLDNRRPNLRLATNAENSRYTRVDRRDNTSGYKGVSWSKFAKKWHAQVRFEGRSYHLGYFVSPEVAALAYNAKALELHGDFALGNKMPLEEAV